MLILGKRVNVGLDTHVGELNPVRLMEMMMPDVKT